MPKLAVNKLQDMFHWIIEIIYYIYFFADEDITED